MVTFWFQVCEGECFAHGRRNFNPPRFAPTQFHHLFFTKRITSIRVFFLLWCSSLKRITSIQSLSLTLPSEDGESRQKPRGLKKGVPPFQHVSLLDFDYQYGHVGV